MVPFLPYAKAINYGEDYHEFVNQRGGTPDLTDPDMNEIMYLTMCMVGEAGETADSWKKVLKGTNSILDFINEIGDMHYYATAILNKIGYTWEDVEAFNVEKLKNRLDKAGG